MDGKMGEETRKMREDLAEDTLNWLHNKYIYCKKTKTCSFIFFQANGFRSPDMNTGFRNRRGFLKTRTRLVGIDGARI